MHSEGDNLEGRNGSLAALSGIGNLTTASRRIAELSSSQQLPASSSLIGQEPPFFELRAMYLATQVRSAHARYT